MIEACANCDTKGGLGDKVRTYTVTTPLAVYDTKLCWPCAEKMMAKNRKHWRIEDKSHATP